MATSKGSGGDRCASDVLKSIKINDGETQEILRTGFDDVVKAIEASLGGSNMPNPDVNPDPGQDDNPNNNSDPQYRLWDGMHSLMEKMVSILGGLGSHINSIMRGIFGIDFQEKFDKFMSYMKSGIDTIKGIGDSLANKASDVTSSFWDGILDAAKFFAAIFGIYKFMEGFQKATDWFGENADFGERIASSLATVIAGFTGMDDAKAQEMAKSISDWIDAMSEITSALTSTIGEIWNWLSGDDLFNVGSLMTSFSDLGNKMWEFKEELLIAALLIAPGSTIRLATFALTSTLSLLGAGIAALGATFSTIIAPILPMVAIVGGITLAGYAIYNAVTAAFDKFEETGNLWESIQFGVSEGVSAVGELLSTIGTWLAELLGLDILWNKLKELGVIDKISNFFGEVGDMIGAKVSEWVTDLGMTFGPIWDNVKGKFTGLKNWIYNSETGEVMGFDLGTMFDDAVDWITDIPSKIAAKIESAFQPLLDVFDNLKQLVWDALPERVQGWFSDEEKAAADVRVDPASSAASALNEKIQMQQLQIDELKDQIASMQSIAQTNAIAQQLNLNTNTSFHMAPFKVVTPVS